MKQNEKLLRLIDKAEKAEKTMIRAFNRWQKAQKAATAISIREEKKKAKAIGGEHHLDDYADAFTLRQKGIEKR